MKNDYDFNDILKVSLFTIFTFILCLPHDCGYQEALCVVKNTRTIFFLNKEKDIKSCNSHNSPFMLFGEKTTLLELILAGT